MIDMWANDREKIGFVHIPRTGGASIKAMIGGFSRTCHKHHGWLKDIKHPNTYKDYFIFTIVRHPYEKYASEYHRRYKKTHNKGNNRRPPELQAQAEEHVKTFHSYLQHILDRGDSLLQLDYITHPFLTCETYRFEDRSLADIARDACERAGFHRAINKKHHHWEGKYDWSYWVSKEGKAMLDHYCERDFQAFGYAMG